MDVMKKYNLGAYESLQRTSPMTWSRTFFKLGSCCNDNLDNLYESFNRTISNAKKMPLLDMLEDIKKQCMQCNVKRLLVANRRMTRFTPRAHAELELTRDKSKECIRYMSIGGLHEIDFHGDACTINMVGRTCGCGRWQLNGLPYIHLMCVITSLRLRAEDYVSDYYSIQKWREAYVSGIKPVQSMTYWPRLNRLPVLPPPLKLQTRGRESNHSRRKGPHESTSHKGKMTRDGRILTCSICRQEGHNKRRCSNLMITMEKRPRGCPRKHQGVETSQGGASQASQGRSYQASQGGASQA